MSIIGKTQRRALNDPRQHHQARVSTTQSLFTSIQAKLQKAIPDAETPALSIYELVSPSPSTNLMDEEGQTYVGMKTNFPNGAQLLHFEMYTALVPSFQDMPCYSTSSPNPTPPYTPRGLFHHLATNPHHTHTPRKTPKSHPILRHVTLANVSQSCIVADLIIGAAPVAAHGAPPLRRSWIGSAIPAPRRTVRTSLTRGEGRTLN